MSIDSGKMFKTNGWAKILDNEFASYQFQVGVFSDKPAKRPAFKEFKPLARHIALKAGKNSDLSLQELGAKLQDKYEWLTFGVKKSKNADVLRFLRGFIDTVQNKRKNNNALQNYLSAIVINPIVRKEIGGNSQKWAMAKGFNWLLVATGTFLKSIQGRVIKFRQY